MSRGARTPGLLSRYQTATDRRVAPEEGAFPRLVPVPDQDAAGHPVGAGGPAPTRPVAERHGPGPLPLFAGMTIGEIAERAGLRRIDVLAWRDYDDPEAGGSELHAHRILSAWSRAGLDVSLTTSSVPDGRKVIRRDGYRVIRRAGRYSVFPRSILSGALGRIGTGDGVVEIWNGMPFFSPLWSRSPQITFLHHVHAEMWRMVLPHGMAEFGYLLEHRVAPPCYRRSRIVTLSESSKAEIVDRLHLRPERISVTPPGVEPRFSPGGERSEVPLVVAVGRLVPVKRFDLLVEALVALKADHPDLQAVIAGEGYERPALEALIHSHRAERWIRLPGFVSDEDLVGLYRQAWALASTSLREGWGMTVTEAGACGTPSVVTRIGGHEDAVQDRRSGILADTRDDLVRGLDAVLRDDVLRRRLGVGALEHAQQFTWDATASGALAALGEEALARQG